MSTRDPVNVRFVANPGSEITGMSRYAQGLREALSAQGTHVGVARIALPPIPAPLMDLSASIGVDFRQFFATYPLSLPQPPPGGILHLTNQQQACGLAFRRRVARTVITVHDVITLKYARDSELTGYLKIHDRLFDRIMARGLKNATAIIADSNQTRADVHEILGYPSNRVFVVNIGVDQSVFHPMAVPDQFLERYGLRRDVPYLLYVGSEDPRKNVRRLLEAFAQIAAHHPDARLIKVGAARFEAEREQLLRRIARLGLTERVYLFDQVSDADLAYFYNCARVFVFPSLYEGFGLPALEAMACGTPVVTSNSSSLPEIVGDAAVLVDPYDVTAISAAVAGVLSEPSTHWATLRQRGLERASEFSWSQTANQVLDIYRHILHQPHSSLGNRGGES